MKLRNLANKFLLVIAVAVLLFSNFTFVAVPSITHLTPADDAITPFTKTYAYDQYNENQPTHESIYTALGVTDYVDYLSALSVTKKLNDVVIAVVDTGLDNSQPVFADRVLTEYAMDFSNGLPSTDNNHWSVDENGHGTHVAGLIADMTLPNVKILPLKIFRGVNNESGDYSFLNAMRYLCALKSGEKVTLLDNSGAESKTYYNTNKVKIANIVAVNLSLGSSGFDVTSRMDMTEFRTEKYGYTQNGVFYTGYQNIIDNLIKKDILPIVAAGNRTSGEHNGKAYYCLPGACDGVLQVSAYENTENEYALANYSYYNDCVSLAAPGTKIWSACSDDIASKLTLEHIQETDLLHGRIYYEYNYGTRSNPKTWYVMKDANDVFYLRSTGTSMATPFVAACYALLMSDPSKIEAADYGLTSWEPENKDGDDAKFMTIAHKALLAAAATDGVHTATYSEEFGYGTVAVGGFVPEEVTGTVRELVNINYEIQPSTTYQNATWDGMNYTVENSNVDWFMVCVILSIGFVGIYVIKSFRGYVMSITRRKETNDDEQ
ncbi:MAG: S8 family serine peptidase [Clostridia bacterium]|nr:S8 family serine peptidase [Clostridia bacterium]